MMAGPNLEAGSLSSLNFLAANPPQYPVNPTEEPREPLVLYISRVPGTRDVILSTFKPQLKNVTAVDVASSLYYVHLDLPSDELLVPRAPSRGEDSPRPSSESMRGPIPRKPLPPTAMISGSAETANSGPANRTDGTHPHDHEPSRASLPPTYETEPGSSGPPRGAPEPALQPPPGFLRPGPAPIARKPLGPRPMEAPPVPEKDSPPRPNPYLSNTKLSAPHPVQDPSFPSSRKVAQASSPTHDSPVARSPSPRKSCGRRPSSTPFSLTLIRRDPASGHQWNVGKISSDQTNDFPLAGFDPYQAPPHVDVPCGEPRIDIRLENSGYAKFRGMPTAADIDALRSASATSLPLPRGAARDRTSSDAARAGPRAEWNIEEGFTRQVVMSYSKTWASNLRHAFRKRERPRSDPVPAADYTLNPAATEILTRPPPPREPYGGRHARHESVASTASVESFGSRNGATETAFASVGPPSPPSPLITQPGPGLKAKGYVFTSPWEGRCEFRTGNGGRSLKCRHILHPGGPGSGHDAAGPATLMHGHEGASGVALASELRFNLPSTDFFATAMQPPSDDVPAGNHRNLHNRFSRILKLDPRHRGESDGEDEAPMDLSLGREKAGGGNRGARAKLGKLIIYDGGLKMLDLIVAANMGVWWVAWEKVF